MPSVCCGRVEIEPKIVSLKFLEYYLSGGSNPSSPQILIDFEEDAYRRCDQNTCVTYPIVSIVAEGGEVTVRFAPGAVLRTRHQGGPYREQMPVIGSNLVTIGACAFRGTDDVYPLDKVGKSQ